MLQIFCPLKECNTYYKLRFCSNVHINLRELINSFVCLLSLVSKDVSKAVHELYIRGGPDKYVPDYVRSSVVLMLQVNLLQ